MLAKIKFKIEGQPEKEETVLPDVKSEYLFSSGMSWVVDYLSKKYSWDSEKINWFQMEWVDQK